jgi:hypothetical protein
MLDGQAYYYFQALEKHKEIIIGLTIQHKQTYLFLANRQLSKINQPFPL